MTWLAEIQWQVLSCVYAESGGTTKVVSVAAVYQRVLQRRVSRGDLGMTSGAFWNIIRILARDKYIKRVGRGLLSPKDPQLHVRCEQLRNLVQDFYVFDRADFAKTAVAFLTPEELQKAIHEHQPSHARSSRSPYVDEARDREGSNTSVESSLHKSDGDSGGAPESREGAL